MAIKKKHNVGCTCCEPRCCEADFTGDLTVTIGGLGSTTINYCGFPTTCVADCSNINGTYILAKVSECVWQVTAEVDTVCSGTPGPSCLVVTVTIEPDPRKIRLSVVDPGGACSTCFFNGLSYYGSISDLAQDCIDLDIEIDMAADYLTGSCIGTDGTATIAA